MFVRGTILSLAALLALGVLAESATAEDRNTPRRVIIEDEYYPGPPFIRHVPGLRIFFGDYALTEEEFEELYGTGRRVYRDEEQRRKATEREQQKQKKKQNKTAAKPPRQDTEQKKPASKTAGKTDPASGLSCEKATSVVSGYGFSSVTPSSCSGKVYAFNAVRDGKSFAIKIDPKSGELTEVKKLP